MSTDATEVVLHEQRGSVALLTLHRPDARNAISPEVSEAMAAALDRIEADDDTRAVVDEKMAAERGAWVNVDARARVRPLRHHAREQRHVFGEQQVRHALHGGGLDAGVGDDDLFDRKRGGVTFIRRGDVALQQRAQVVERVQEAARDLLRRFARRGFRAPKFPAVFAAQAESEQLVVLKAGQKDSIAPDGWAGKAGSCWNLPKQIRSRPKLERWFLALGNALPVRSPELRPTRGRGGSLRCE